MSRLGASFGFLWSSAALSNLADGVLKVGAPLLAVTLTRSPVQVALVGAAATVPWLLLALHAGALADRLDRRRIMVLANTARAAVLAVTALLGLLGLLNLWLLLAAVLLAGVAEVFADLAAQSVLPMTVPAARLTAANGRVQSAQMIGNDFVGAPLAGVLVTLAPVALFYGPAALYGVAGLLLLGMRGTFRPAPTGEPRRPIRQDIAEAMRYLWSQHFLRTLAVSAGLLNFANAAYFAVLVLWTVGPGSAMELTPSAYGLMLTVFAAGAVAGSMFSERAAGLVGEGRLLVGCWLTSALLLTVPVLAPTPWTLYPTALLWGVTGGAANVLVISTRQRLIPAELLGRVNAAYRLIGMGGMPAGAALGGVVAEFAGLPAVFLGAAAVCVGAVMPVWRALSRRISSPLTSEGTLSDISRSR
ncbi:MFS transporter [Nonomuraea sp. NN258]|uniref:MFS transporter n=1 Tax=Nonomuraea antri TaxID=2730852 RepID=UPI0015690D5D|nr:MFS transporter [Nonomuraea antri]NRQ33991.1 MFS transporter [Nonomuraea antri]